MGASESLLVAGIVCIVAAVVGGGVKMLGAEMPVLGSFPRQALLFAVGLAFLLASFAVNQPKPAPAASAASGATSASGGAPAGGPQSTASSLAPASPGPGSTTANGPPQGAASNAPGAQTCGPGSALACLPRSSAPVTFRDPAAANTAAIQNVADALSTTAAAAQAAAQGASGRAARLCGIVASNDSSPLGKHMAAERLTTPGSVGGQATTACLAMARAFL
jgi:hypothetical protein